MIEMLKTRKEQLQEQGKKGFTLMEMLIVIAIIAILIAIAIPLFTSQLNAARAATDEANARSMYAQLQANYMLKDSSSSTPAEPSINGKKVTYDGTTYEYQDTCTVLNVGTTTGGAPAVHLTTNGNDFYFGAADANAFTPSNALIGS